ncbi:hypothetical protein AWL63_20555 [Sphingomonas panacis]|uniref:Uncharacterized protein n=1 Tax=Sphingomonas panacis TaxID=1560345 RepID=A0A1B3ZEZ1_9SPHN|nr:hypothetical protein AWL63_20555 [Sphingomonas panacis]
MPDLTISSVDRGWGNIGYGFGQPEQRHVIIVEACRQSGCLALPFALSHSPPTGVDNHLRHVADFSCNRDVIDRHSLPLGSVGGGDDPRRSDQNALTLSRDIRKGKEIVVGDHITGITHVMSSHDGSDGCDKR